jgi:hypothetical protein
MLTSSIGLILVFSGIVTVGGGVTAFLFPHLFLRLGFGTESVIAPATVFFVRHWGVLVFVVGALIVLCAFAIPIRASVLIAAAIEKLAMGALIFFGPMKRTPGMTAIAIVDGVFAVLYIAYLGGL